MKTYKVKIEFVRDYLQARFSEDAKKELENYISKGIVKTPDDSWITLLHFDDNGIYIPAIQIRNACIRAGRSFKVKKTRRSQEQWVISNFIVEPENIYLGKTKPDKILISYPARKDGNRVTIKHPVILTGTQVEFFIKSLDDDMEDKAIQNILEEAGKTWGIGTRRRDLFGRFKVVSFKIQ